MLPTRLLDERRNELNSAFSSSLLVFWPVLLPLLLLCSELRRKVSSLLLNEPKNEPLPVVVSLLLAGAEFIPMVTSEVVDDDVGKSEVVFFLSKAPLLPTRRMPFDDAALPSTVLLSSAPILSVLGS